MFRTSAVRAPPMQVHPSNADYKKTCARSAAEGPLGLVAMDCFAPWEGGRTTKQTGQRRGCWVGVAFRRPAWVKSRYGRGDAPL